MCTALSAFGKILLVSSACSIALSICIGVHGWGWPSLVSDCSMETAVFALMNGHPLLPQLLMTWLLILFVKYWEWCCRWMVWCSFWPCTCMWPPTWLQAFSSSERYDALLWIARTILLTPYVSIASSCVRSHVAEWFSDALSSWRPRFETSAWRT